MRLNSTVYAYKRMGPQFKVKPMSVEHPQTSKISMSVQEADCADTSRARTVAEINSVEPTTCFQRVEYQEIIFQIDL